MSMPSLSTSPQPKQPRRYSTPADEIPSPANIPLRLVEHRPCFEIHAMLRFNRIPYTVESTSLPFCMDRPLPILVHGELLLSSRALVLEHVAGYKPCESQSSDRELEVLAEANTISGFADDATLSSYFEKQHLLLLHLKSLQGVTEAEQWLAMPRPHALASWVKRNITNVLTFSADRNLPDVSIEDVVMRLDEFYSALNKMLVALREKHGFIGTAVKSAYAVSSGQGGGAATPTPTPGRRQSVNLTSSNNLIAAMGRTYSLPDAVLFGHLTEAFCFPFLASLLGKYEAISTYHRNIALEFFSNSSTSSSKRWELHTLEVLKGNAYCHPSAIQETLREKLVFNVPAAEEEQTAESARQEADWAMAEAAALASNGEDGTKDERSRVHRTSFSVNYSEFGGNSSREAIELVICSKTKRRTWQHTLPIEGLGFSALVVAGIVVGFLLHRR